ncbi:hypothetical protein LKM00_24680 [Bacillus wiedmannii]|nr:hypothetical protein [Bacillus wiedmannii]EEK66948.1 hypothetical protein bcere0006_29140 [Bacillus wiedmannii]MCC2380592.1 hypothetical protein [Bacillus wiedmannii]MCC2424692.1 hypothetical protein [Bacillus wiedmannii]
MFHEWGCQCKKCFEEIEDGLYSMFPNANTEDELEEELDRSFSKMLDR